MFTNVPVLIRNWDCKWRSPLFSNWSIKTLEELMGCGILGIGTLSQATIPRSGIALEQVHNGLKKQGGY